MWIFFVGGLQVVKRQGSTMKRHHWDWLFVRSLGRRFNARLMPQESCEDRYLRSVVRLMYGMDGGRTVGDALAVLWHMLTKGTVPGPGQIASIPRPVSAREIMGAPTASVRTSAARWNDRRDTADAMPRTRIERLYLRHLLVFLWEVPKETPLQEVCAALWHVWKNGHLPEHEAIAQRAVVEVVSQQKVEAPEDVEQIGVPA
jgi:hypothetical protein